MDAPVAALRAPVAGSVLELVGGTPLVRLGRIGAGLRLWAKAEHLSPGGSVKDRICLAMIEAAEATGALRPGQTVVEATSGNTGIGLAIVCAVKKHPLVLTMPRSMSPERRQLLAAYGAELVLTDPAREMAGAVAEARRIAEARGAFVPGQFDNPANPAAHVRTADEIVEALGRVPAAVVAGVGTGGTVSGAGRRLRALADLGAAARPRIVAVEPAASAVLSGGAPRPSRIQGLNAGFVPANFDRSVVDAITTVTDEDAHATKVRLAREEGLLVGISAGANVHAARAVAEELGPDADVVTILCDTGERYFSLDASFRRDAEGAR